MLPFSFFLPSTYISCISPYSIYQLFNTNGCGLTITVLSHQPSTVRHIQMQPANSTRELAHAHFGLGAIARVRVLGLPRGVRQRGSTQEVAQDCNLWRKMCMINLIFCNLLTVTVFCNVMPYVRTCHTRHKGN